MLITLALAALITSSTGERVLATTKTSWEGEVPTGLRSHLVVDGPNVVVTVTRERDCFRETQFNDDVRIYEHNDWALPAAVVLGSAGALLVVIGGAAAFFPPQPAEIDVVDGSGNTTTVVAANDEAERDHVAGVVGGIAGGVTLGGLAGVALLLQDVPRQATTRVRTEREAFACAPVPVANVDVKFVAGGSVFVRKKTDIEGTAIWRLNDSDGFFNVITANVDDENAGPEASVAVKPSLFFPRLRREPSVKAFDAFRAAFPSASLPDDLAMAADRLRTEAAIATAERAAGVEQRAREWAELQERDRVANEAGEAQAAKERAKAHARADAASAKLRKSEEAACLRARSPGDGTDWVDVNGFVGRGQVGDKKTGSFRGKGLRWRTYDGMPAFVLGDVRLDVDPTGQFGGADLHQAVVGNSFNEQITLPGRCDDKKCRSGTLSVLGNRAGTFSVSSSMREDWAGKPLPNPRCVSSLSVEVHSGLLILDHVFIPVADAMVLLGQASQDGTLDTRR